jgi:ABC-2 type transport system ATP-binding protein
MPNEAHSSPAVEVEHLTKRYSGQPVVDDLSFTVERGEIFALLGPNGAGKTTTVEILEGLRRPDGGKARVLGLDPQREGSALRPRVGAMLQEGGVPTGMRAREVLTLFARFYRDPVPVDTMLELAGLTGAARTLGRHLSGGQRQRLSLAMALIGRPELVFLDEPTVGMDTKARRDTWTAIGELTAGGTTVILTTHHLLEAEELAHRVAILHRGRLLALDTPSGLSELASMKAMTFSTADAIAPEELANAIGQPVALVNGSYRVDASPTPQLVASVAGWLSDRNVLLSEMRVGGASLEEAFLILTEEEREEGEVYQ